ncbi:hypothetical protein AK830_g2826 [Neonectria ditissima]|uniref:Uncharacterized protein n=1 Tax=Neonectria ditissima TaxID=78410 RepID=A0A0P7BSM5_9HYPO|nr:hypothetical protein AK830_g2826 [Neonectria ditissima]
MDQQHDQGAQRPQPSFPIMADHLQGLSLQMGLCANLPAVDGGSAILQAVNTLTANLNTLTANVNTLAGKVDNLVAKVDAKIDNLEAKVDNLETKVDNLGKQLGYYDTNQQARIQNSGLTRPSTELDALVNVETGDEIDGFPKNVQEALNANGALVNQILMELNLSTAGRPSAKKGRMMVAIGIQSVRPVRDG